jgi:hypothetical protein
MFSQSSIAGRCPPFPALTSFRTLHTQRERAAPPPCAINRSRLAERIRKIAILILPNLSQSRCSFSVLDLTKGFRSRLERLYIQPDNAMKIRQTFRAIHILFSKPKSNRRMHRPE